MRTVSTIAAFSLVSICVAMGCSSQSEKVGAESDSISKNPPPDPDPCIPSCAGKACGAADGCGHTCSHGYCPVGTTCGGGGTVNVCACAPSCGGKACGTSDGCGGICNAGSCPTGQSCGMYAPGVCAPIPTGQGVACFVFDDGYASMEGPSDAIVFTSDGQACIPNGSTGTCRKWFGRCRTTDSSHTPVTFEVGAGTAQNISWSTPSDAVLTESYSSFACIPGTSPDCRDYFGNGSMAGIRPVHCRLFDDGYTNPTALSNKLVAHYDFNATRKYMWGEGLNGATRKWFGRCEVGGCGDGVCDGGETHANCPSDCTCGDGMCNNNETAASCPKDCGPRCGDGKCNGAETCTSCSHDCGACRPATTCSGAVAGPSAATFSVNYEDTSSCAGSVTAFANSQSEAETCVGNLGVLVVASTATTSIFTFHTDPTNGCTFLSVPAFSQTSAATCAGWQGYSLDGPCP